MGLHPLVNNWSLQTVLRGVKRDCASFPQRKLPVTPDILKGIYGHLDLNCPRHIVFCAAYLVAFFVFLESLIYYMHLNQDRLFITLFNLMCLLQICLLLRIRSSKTNQFQNKILYIPLPLLFNNALCPVTAVTALLLSGHMSGDSVPLFSCFDRDVCFNTI